MIHPRRGAALPGALVLLMVSGGVVAASAACDGRVETVLASEEGGPGSPPLSEAGPAACSTGTPYGEETVFPPGAREGAGPTCVLRCGDTSSATWGGAGNPTPTISALPTGACEDEGAACNLHAVKPCATQGPNHGTYMLFECRCQSGNWTCAAAYRGGRDCAGANDGGLSLAVDGIQCIGVSATITTKTPPDERIWRAEVMATCGALGTVALVVTSKDDVPYPQSCVAGTRVQASVSADGDAGFRAYEANDTRGSCTIASGPSTAAHGPPLRFEATIVGTGDGTRSHDVTFRSANAP